MVQEIFVKCMIVNNSEYPINHNKFANGPSQVKCKRSHYTVCYGGDG